MIHTKDHKTLNNSGSGASKTSPSVPLSKPPESTSSGPLRSATAKTAAFQTRIRLFGLFYTLYTPAEGRSTSSEAGSPLFWSKSGFCPLTLSNRSVSQETGRFELLRNYQKAVFKKSQEQEQTMGFSGIGVLAVGLAYCGFRRFRRSKLGFTQADRERMDQRFDQV